MRCSALAAFTAQEEGLTCVCMTEQVAAGRLPAAEPLWNEATGLCPNGVHRHYDGLASQVP